MSGHRHVGGPGLTQNQGNVIGDRPCVRQSRLYREHVGGNTMKELMGQETLKWDTTKTQGAYNDGSVYDHGTDSRGVPQSQQPAPQQENQPTPQQTTTVHRRGAGAANKQSYNFLSHE